MDVHPPSERVHTWKDFFVHLSIVTIGLLIALALESTVEWAHHRELVALTRGRLHVELTTNREALHGDRAALKEASEHMRANSTLLRRLQTGKTGATGTLWLSWTFNGFDNSAMETARETGALNYMPFEQVQAYSRAYLQQKFAMDAATAFIAQVHDARSVMSRGHVEAELTPGEIDELLRGCSLVLTKIELLDALLSSLDVDYQEVLGSS